MDSFEEIQKELWSDIDRRIEEESLPVPRNRQKTQKVKLSREPRTWNEEQLEEYYRKIIWNNPTFIRDSRSFFALSNAVKKKLGESTVISILRYCDEKNKLVPRYVLAVLSAKLRG